MAIAATEATFSGPYSHDGSTTVYDYDFKIYATDELKITRTNADGTTTVLTLTADYTVAGVSDAGGGEYTLVNVDRLPTGTTMIAEPDVARSQTRVFSTQSSISLDQIETALDKLTSMARQAYSLILAAPRAAAGVTIGLLTRGAADTVLMWDADGNVVEGPTSGAVAAAQTNAETAAAEAAQATLDAAAAAASLAAINAKITVSTDAPSGGSEGDLWLRYTL
ncbi:tailspike protein [Octadecabacter Antarctic BD virus 1]|nr:tailspike protein [Octadecabacter Antarctic BD virus 1]